MFKPKAIFYEEAIQDYVLGKELLNKFSDVPKVIIENHNSIKEMQEKENKEFLQMKTNLIIGTRKTHKFVPNHKISDFLVPYTSSRMYSFLYVLLFSL
jgi:spore photoproduct lyase